MDQDAYIILFDENGSPYIAHGIISSARNAYQNLKERIHKYILKVEENGGWRYFYSQAEIEAWKRAKQNRMNAEEQIKKEQDTGMSSADEKMSAKKKIESDCKAAYETAATNRKQAENKLAAGHQYLNALAEYHPNDGKRIQEAYRRVKAYEQEVQQARSSEDQAKKAYERAQKERIQAEKDYELNQKSHNENLSMLQKNLSKAQEEEKEAYKTTPQGRQEEKTAEKVVKSEKKAISDLKKSVEKGQKDYEKEMALNTENYDTRRKRSFKTGTTGLWNRDKKNSAYSDEALNNSVEQALKNDGVQSYRGDNPQIKQAQNTVKSTRKAYEEHAVDLQMAELQAKQVKIKMDKAKEAYDAVMDDTTSSRSTKKEADSIYRSLKKQYEQYIGDIETLQNMMQDEQKAYRSAIQIYNMNLHIYGLK